MYKRILNLSQLLEKKSFFLFGPRATGKSTLVKTDLIGAKVYDLLDSRTFNKLIKNPSLIEEEYNNENIVVIDEIQKLPSILDEVHRLIENKGIKFLLTGSSKRILKHGGANLLAGKTSRLFSLVYKEIDDFDLEKYLNFGGLPTVYKSKYPYEELENYIGTYLKEEIKAEAVTRNIQAFSEFLDILAISNGYEINFESFASDCGVSSNTIKNYIQIIEDTLIGFQLKAYTKTKKRKAISRSKFYFFDIGVTNCLSNRSKIKLKSKEFGEAFEHFIILEIRAFNSYMRKNKDLRYWRSHSQFEVDLLINNELAIEIKGSSNISNKHLKGLRALKEENIFNKYIVVSNDDKKRVLNDNIIIYPWQSFLNDLWDNKIM